MLVIGLTGGIGSGKTQVSDWFAKQGIAIIDADILAREVVSKGSFGLQQIINKFGNWVVDETGELNRQAMRAYAFSHPQSRRELEQITHPAIRELAKQRLAQATSPYVILVAPLLLEASKAGLATLCQRILVVDVNENTQRQRASQRDDQTQEQIDKIMATQISRAERLKQADDIIDNNGNIMDLYPQLEALHCKYLTISLHQN